MRAWVCTELTGEDGLSFEEHMEPVCGPGQVQVKTKAVALNYPDVLITRGKYQLKQDPPFVPGSELAEEVVVSPPMQQVMAIPGRMSYEEAAAFNMVHGTAMHGLEQRGFLQPGETVLVLGAAGGCGGAAVQVANAMGAKVIAGASSQTKCEKAREAGADAVINYGVQDLRERALELTKGRGVDMVFDPVGDKLFRPAIRSLAWNGRYLVVGFAGGDIPELGVNYTIMKSVSVVGVAYGMSAAKDPAMNMGNFMQLFEWYEQGLIKPMIGGRYVCDELPDALREMYAGDAVGKSVVSFGY
ncbi:MAG: NADPH:quinone oxidoreductase family protein [Halioglobus sp.]